MRQGKYEDVVEAKIRAGQEAGAFDNLPGKGKPLRLRREPGIDPLSQIMYDTLAAQGLTHPVLDEYNDLNERKQAIRERWAKPRSEAVTAKLREQCDVLNKQIRSFNLSNRIARFHTWPLELEDDPGN